MGSVVGTVGDKFGLVVPPGPGGAAPLPGAGGIAAGQFYVLTSIYLPVYPTVVSTTFIYTGFEFGWRAFLTQLVPQGGGTGSVLVQATLDGATAQGLGQAWETLPAPGAGTGVWSNPMTDVAGTRLFRINSGPWVAFQLAVSTFVAGTGSYVLFSAGG